MNKKSASSFGEWEEIKDKVIIRIMKRKGNEELLDLIPCAEMEDTILGFYINVGEKYGEAVVLINDNDLLEWRKKTEIDTEDIFYQALDNLLHVRFVLTDVEDFAIGIMKQLGKIEEGFQKDWMSSQFFLSTETKKYGASAILRTDLLQQFANEIDGNFYLTLDAENRLSLFPENQIDEEYGKERMEQCRKSEEAVSNKLYYFDKDSGELTIVG